MTTNVRKRRHPSDYSTYQTREHSGSKPKRMETLDLTRNTRRVRIIPSTTIVVIMDDKSVTLRDWRTYHSHRIPVACDATSFLGNVDSFKVDCIEKNVIIVNALDAIDAHATPQFDLSATSVTIIDAKHFLLAASTYIAIYEVTVIGSSGEQARAISICDQYALERLTQPSTPSIGTVTKCGDTTHIAVHHGNFLRWFSLTDKIHKFIVHTGRFSEQIPAFSHFNMGHRIGIYNKPSFPATLKTVDVTEPRYPVHPTGLAPHLTDPTARQRGAVTLNLSRDETIEDGTLDIDEWEGRITFILCTNSIRRTTEVPRKVVIIELV
ncbi:hypothetical protein B0H16DRAFT_1465178 [Mycena metata]|uniref:Uncharacterized protein n=1 Tax=Mycena metata TaxID=1033252 RepID=A0AAD7IC43_9AGAR|nr:hypothetical protein B0H16DRAFT_1465178 [Mycena metata]